MKCFYHADADGRCAGFWVKLSAAITDKSQYDIKFIEINYGMPFPFDIIQQDEQIYIVDYSIEPQEMLRLLEITKDVTWIDHHKTAIAKYVDFPCDIRGVRVDGVAACMLTYCYLHHMTDRGIGTIIPFDTSMTEKAPKFTKLITDWDVWKFEYGNDTRNFITNFNTRDFCPWSSNWDDFFINDCERICDIFIRDGAMMNRFRDQWAKEYCRVKGFETVIDGRKAFAMNLGMCNSEYFKSISGYDILMPFCFDGETWTVSMYSQTVDVSEIAKKYGGGGHKGASGFQCKELPFVKK